MDYEVNTRSGNDSIKNKGEKLQKIVTGVYIFIILGIFPLVFYDYYYDILVFKYRFYIIVTSVFLIIMFVLNMILQTHDKNLNKEKYSSCFLNKSKFLLSPEFFLLLFMLVAFISTIQSDFKYESFWGNEGRYTGCFLILLYGFSIITVSRRFKFRVWCIELFLITGMIICLFGITDYFQMDILKFKVGMDPNQYNMFAATIGNVNSYTSYVALVMAVSIVLFSKEKVVWRMILYYVYMMISFFAIVMGLSDNSYLALGALFAFLPLYIFNTKTGIKRYILILISFSIVIYIMNIINRTMSGSVIEMDGILQKLTSYSRLEYVIISLVILELFVYAIGYVTRDRSEDLGNNWRVAWLVFILMAAIMLVFILVDVNILGHKERYGGLGSYLFFNDEWGTHRGFIWRITLENYSDFSLIHKIFGYGPDTFGILTHFNNYNDMVDKFWELYDSVHNEYLQYLITMGPISLISYVAFLISSGVRMVKNSKENPYVMSIFFAVICFAVQATVNISVPIVAPIMFILLATGLAGAKEKTAENI